MIGKEKKSAGFVFLTLSCTLKTGSLGIVVRPFLATESSFLYMLSVGILLHWEVFCFVWGCFCPDDNFGSCQTSTWTSQLRSCSPTFFRRDTESIPPPHRQRERALCLEQQRSLAFLVANTYSYNHPKKKTCWWQVFFFFCSFHGEGHSFLSEFWFWLFFFFVLWKRHHHVNGVKLLLNPDDGGRMAFCCSFFCKVSSWSCTLSCWQYVTLWLSSIVYTLLAQCSKPAPHRTVLYHWANEVN